MNIFTQLLKPFISTNRPQENIDFDTEPSNDPKTDLRPVMFIKPSKPIMSIISANSLASLNNITTNIIDISDTILPISSSPIITNKIRKSSTSSTKSSGIKWPFSRQSSQIIPEEIITKKQLSIIKESSNENISRQNSPLPSLIHPYQILLNTLYDTPEENLDNYDFHCTNISENLKPYIKKHNHLVDDIDYMNTYNNIITNNPRSISCPDIIQKNKNPWNPPKKHGLQNSQQIIPNYYFHSHHNIQKLIGENENKLLEIDYLFMIKDDIRNMRKLNQYQIDYIQSLDDITKNEIIHEFHEAFNTMIETLTLTRSRESTPHSSSKDLLLRAAEALEPEKNIRTHIPRTSSI